MSRKLLENGTVLSWDDGTSTIKVLEGASILIVGDEIAAIGSGIDEKDRDDSTEIVDMTGKILSPGFINTHCHMWQTAFRSMAPDIYIAQYFPWLSQMGSAKDPFTPHDIYISSLEGYLEGLNAGITSFVDHASTNWHPSMVQPSSEAAIDSGARVWWCYDINPYAGEHFSVDAQCELLKRIQQNVGVANSQVTMGLAFDGFDLSNEASVEHMKKVTHDIKAEALTTHYLGGPWPLAHNSPTSASQHHLPQLGKPIIFSHSGFLTETDIAALRADNTHISITPENEMHEGHGQSTSRYALDHASLGTDTNWNFSGDMLVQSRLLLQSTRTASYQKTLDKGLIPNKNPMSYLDAFLLATRQGALALHRDDIGVLKAGAKADIVCFNGDSPNMLGYTNAVAAVAMHANVGDIEHVLVGGQWRKRDGKLLTKTKEWAEIKADFVKSARRIQGAGKDPAKMPERFMGMAEMGDVEVLGVRRSDG